MPTEVASSCAVNPCSGTWHIAQDIVPLGESRRSKKSLRPSATFAGVTGLSAGTSIAGRPSAAGAPCAAAGSPAETGGDGAERAARERDERRQQCEPAHQRRASSSITRVRMSFSIASGWRKAVE